MNTTKKLENGDVVAFMKTTKGQIEIFLETKKAPVTTANFIGLAKKGYYNGVIFHRVIKDFMIQGGDPEGTGMGGKSIYGEKFKDEFDKDLKNNTFTISMANSGVNTNGSQFFINVKDNNYLDFKHSVFGEVIAGKENVLNISKVKTGANDKPEKEVKIISIEIKEYKDGKFIDYAFDEKKVVEDYKKAEEELKKSPVKEGDTVSVHYNGTLENGEKFDSSYDRGEPIDFQVGSGMMIKGFDKAVVGMKVGEKKSIILKPEDAYGKEEDYIITAGREKFAQIEQNEKLEEKKIIQTTHGDLEILKLTDKEVTFKPAKLPPLVGKTLKFDIEIVDKK
ncbi:peptidylprolyl isomerase [Candidatus Gracilibacteria bacterium]|nr:MAG: peptidylprolyl isomerase [Candidatus Gracilibacteria bacterium]